MAAPDDGKDVLSALRLGWYLAETRGRNRPGAPPGAAADMPDHADHALPLRIERSGTELRIEAQAVVSQLARALGVDDPGDGTSLSGNLDGAAKALARARKPQAGDPPPAADAAGEAWGLVAGLVWRFDAHIQDRLTAVSEMQACGYQLGRGLAETYWALDPGQAGGSTGWSFLLGGDRCGELARLTGRLAAYMDDYTAPAIAGSLEVWKDVAATPDWRGDGQGASQALYGQIRRWYELILLGQDPTTLIKPYALMRNYRATVRAIRLFLPQLVTAILSLVFLILLVILLSNGHGQAWVRSASGILAVLGLSLAGITGTLKNSAQAMTKRLRQDAYTELVAIAVQTAPEPPATSKSRLQRMTGQRGSKARIQQAISRRELTAATPN